MIDNEVVIFTRVYESDSILFNANAQLSEFISTCARISEFDFDNSENPPSSSEINYVYRSDKCTENNNT